MPSARHKPLIVVFALLAVAALALAFGVDVTLVDQPGVRMELPERIEEWAGRELRYCHNEACAKREFFLDELGADSEHCPTCGQPLHNMSKEEYDALPKDTGFIKSRYLGPNDEQIFVAIVLSGRERESIHRPERCLTAQGFTMEKREIVEIPMEGRAPLRVMLIHTQRSWDTPKGPVSYRGYYAYWFVGQGRETPSDFARMFWLAWDRIVHSVAHKWAYISVSGTRDPDGAYLDELRRFIARLHPSIVL